MGTGRTSPVRKLVTGLQRKGVFHLLVRKEVETMQMRHCMGLRHLKIETLTPPTSRQSKIHRTKLCGHALFTHLAMTEAVLIMLKAFFKIGDDKLTSRMQWKWWKQKALRRLAKRRCIVQRHPQLQLGLSRWVMRQKLHLSSSRTASQPRLPLPL